MLTTSSSTLHTEALKSFSDRLDLVTTYAATYPNDNVKIKQFRFHINDFKFLIYFF